MEHTTTTIAALADELEERGAITAADLEAIVAEHDLDEEALAELRAHAGTQFDPMLVEKMHEAYRAGFLDEPRRSSAALYLDKVPKAG